MCCTLSRQAGGSGHCFCYYCNTEIDDSYDLVVNVISNMKQVTCKYDVDRVDMEQS